MHEDVTIVIPTFNQGNFITQCVRSLRRHTEPGYKLILSDDASEDGGARDVLTALHLAGGAQVLTSPVRRGFVRNCNAAAAAVTTDRMCLLNQDTEACAGWLTAMEDAMNDDDKVGIVGAKLLFPRKKGKDYAGKIQHAGVARDRAGAPYHIMQMQEADTPAANVRRNVNAVTGACMLIRMDCWREVGGFSEEFQWGQFEDVDTCWTARKLGWKIVYEPKSVLWHYEHGCGDKYVHEGHDANRIYLLNKWLELGSDEDLFQ